ncbi:hypothetical protein RHMOL_Rhmol08G0061500 [Rhododendron molle]|uniref:Uncharacterized protein n=1 Tax=Rhododendron molle TaxID=49168 RepID=A0ACC0MKD5_RHOML|nr:hypothetical protein RHMOL_Rhmol08G0061500 [Rhododendron molle]
MNQRSSVSVDTQPVSPSVESFEAVGATLHICRLGGQKHLLTITMLDPGKAPHSNENQMQEQEFTSLMQENKKLRSKLLELERGDRDLNLNVQQLWSELGDLESEYARMLAELGAVHD